MRIYPDSGFTRVILSGLAALAVSGLLSPVVQAQTDVTDIFQNTLACALVEPLLADMPAEPLYTRLGGLCHAFVPDDAVREYFSDTDCTTPLVFRPVSLSDHCEVLLDPVHLGEGQGIEAGEWSLPPGARLDLGARSLEGVQWPYLQRRIYRSVETPRGTCHLEMRVYAPNPVSGVTQRPSLLALHGGSWRTRGFGFFGLEMSIPHYVDQGFVVYAPFYRLLGDAEGSPACHQADIGQIVDDASAALAWVHEHASEYGSSATPVVFGQSAGGHLALSLAVNETESVAAAVLFYSPTDFTDFTLRAQQGDYTDPAGLSILQRVLSVDYTQADINASPIPENSFPQRIVESARVVPPVMMIQGMQDALVEARQSVRLCDAMAGRELLPLDAEVEPLSGLRKIVDCGDNSQLQLIREGQHALDVCLAGSILPTQLCRSGSEESREEVAVAIGEAVAFAVEHGTQTADTEGGDNGSNGSARQGGGAGTLWELWLLLSVYWLRRSRTTNGIGHPST